MKFRNVYMAARKEQGKTEELEKEYAYYQSLKDKIDSVTFEELDQQKTFGDAPLIEKQPYCLIAKQLAITFVDLLTEGAFLAVDKLIFDKYKTKKEHLEAVKSFIDEVRQGYVQNDAIYLKFPQVAEGLEHLEELYNGLREQNGRI